MDRTHKKKTIVKPSEKNIKKIREKLLPDLAEKISLGCRA